MKTHSVNYAGHAKQIPWRSGDQSVPTESWSVCLDILKFPNCWISPLAERCALEGLTAFRRTPSAGEVAFTVNVDCRWLTAFPVEERPFRAAKSSRKNSFLAPQARAQRSGAPRLAEEVNQPTRKTTLV